MTGCGYCEEAIRAAGPALVGACASVGIEKKKSTAEMFDIWLASQHQTHGKAQPHE